MPWLDDELGPGLTTTPSLPTPMAPPDMLTGQVSEGEQEAGPGIFGNSIPEDYGMLDQPEPIEQPEPEPAGDGISAMDVARGGLEAFRTIRNLNPVNPTSFIADLVTTGKPLALVDADMSLYNPIISALRAMHPRFEADKGGHNPMDLIGGTKYEANADEFVGSLSKAETQWRMAKFDNEMQKRKMLEELPLRISIPLGLYTGMLDPFNIIPFGGPVLRVIKGTARAARPIMSALKFGAIGGASMGASEAVLHNTQMTRENYESILPIAAGILIPGIMGAATARLTTKQLNKIASDLTDDVVSHIYAGGSGGAARVDEPGAGGLRSGAGPAKWKWVNPLGYLQTSTSPSARRTASKLSDTGLMMKEHDEGIVTAGDDHPGTVETRITAHDGPLAEAHSETDSLYAQYFYGRSVGGPAVRARSRGRSAIATVTGTRGQRLKPREFREEIGKAMRNNDEHAIPEVAAAAKHWRKKVFDPMYEAAIEARLLKRGPVRGAPSYLTRMYKHDMVSSGTDRNGNTFREVLIDHFLQTNPGHDRADIVAIVDDVIDKILGMPGLRALPTEFFSNAGPLQERVLNIPDNMIEDFLESDIEKVGRYYVNAMGPDIELAKKFGDPQMEGAIGKINDEYMAMRHAATTRKEKDRLRKEHETVIETVKGIRDRLRGTYGLPKNPESIANRAFRFSQQVNVLRMMGMATLSSMSDMARPIMTQGLHTVTSGLVPILRNIGTGNIKLSRAQMREFGAVTDMVLHGRMLEMADITHEWRRGSKAGRGVGWMVDHFGAVNLLSQWTSFWKQFTAITAMNHIMKATKAVSEGRATPKMIRDLAADYIDEDLAREIWRNFSLPDGGGLHKGMHLPNTEMWENRRAREALNNALIREVERTIVTPRAEKPLWTSTPWGRTITQFKSFAFASTTKVLAAGLQQRDAKFAVGLVALVGLGSLAATLKMLASGQGEKLKNWSPTKFIVEGVDHSGILGILSEIHNTVEKATLGTIGMNQLTGEESSRYAMRNWTGALGGPTVGLAEDAKDVFQSFWADGMVKKDIHAIRQLAPYQNLFYLRLLLNKLEDGVTETLGIPKTRKVTKGARR